MNAPTKLQAAEPSDPIASGRDAMAAGDFSTAAALFHSRAAADLSDYEARYWLYSALYAGGEVDAAGGILDEARNLHAFAVLRALDVDVARIRTDRGYCAEVGDKLRGMHLMAAAAQCLGRALNFDEPDLDLMLGYGFAIQHQGRVQEAIDVFTAAAEIFDVQQIRQLLFFLLFHVDDRMNRISQEVRSWAKQFASVDTPSNSAFPNKRSSDRRLRIGYVAPSFTGNQITPSTAPVLESHDPEAVEVFVYCLDPTKEDAFPKHCRLRAIANISDKDVAEMVRKDRIDILVDLWGPSAGSRLGMFAYRPAPIQFGWMNFTQSTGLACMDYVMHADSLEVPGTEAYFTEEIWRTGEIMAPYRPSADRLPPSPTPALANGYITFGSFNNPIKLSEPTIAAWGAILSNDPTHRLILKYKYFVDPVLQRVTQARLAAYGVRPEQVEFRGHSIGVSYSREFQDIDLALDPSPAPGGTTTCDAISNGVPVLILKGDDYYARLGLPLLLPCGLSELVAESWDDYVTRALELTSDVAALNALRGRIRPGFDNSAYRDEVGFTRRLEADYRKMFDRWLEASA